MKTTLPRRGRKATGSLVWRGRWFARITLADGSRPLVELDPTIPEADREAARACAARVSAEARAAGAVGPGNVETLAEYAGRWLAAREARGLVTVADDRARLRSHVLPSLGAKDVRDVTRDDLEALVERLDGKVRAGALGWKTAGSTWSLVASLFADAHGAKRRELRVRLDNPAHGVHGPDRGDVRSKTFLRPGELAALLACEGVPLYRRRLYALAAYTALRVGEIRGLRVGDVDLAAGQISVVRQADRLGQDKGRTKTRRARVVPIEAALAPLLAALVTGRGEGARLLEVRNEDHARLVREDLATAGCTREALTADDDMRAPFVFHNFRDTCLTHMAVRRDPPQDIQWRAGHTTPAMTERYIAQARFAAGRSFGEPLAPLPLGALGISAPVLPQGAGEPSNSNDLECEGRDLKPGDVDPKRPDSPAIAATSEGVPAGEVTLRDDAEHGADAERALARALELAAVAGRWDVVAQLARELEARRLEAEPNVVTLRRGRP